MAENFNQTRRSVCKDLEEIIFETIPVLDHGFIRVVDYMGDDSAIVQAARVSYGTGTKQVNQDKGLINYLMKHYHNTPFEMCEIKLHVKLPIFVARQWIRHRTASVNEYSARYSILAKEFYLPDSNIIASQSQNNKQGRSDDPVSSETVEKVLNILKTDSTQCYQHYTELMNEDENGNTINSSETGIARELARINLTLNYYTEWYWKIDLHNLLNFLMLRTDQHAQYEIRVYADIILDIVKKWVPYTYNAFLEYRKNGVHLSRTQLEVVKLIVSGKEVIQENSNLSKREWKELMDILGRN